MLQHCLLLFGLTEVIRQVTCCNGAQIDPDADLAHRLAHALVVAPPEDVHAIRLATKALMRKQMAEDLRDELSATINCGVYRPCVQTPRSSYLSTRSLPYLHDTLSIT